MIQTFLALGSNVGDRKQHIATAIKLISGKVSNIKQAYLYESKAVGYTEQDNFINTVLKGDTDLSPEELLKFVKKIEDEVGRIYRFKWGPREIDIDILFYADEIIRNKNLEIPHPGLHERDFVLRPFTDLNPDFVHPVLKKTIRQMLKELPKNNISILQKLRETIS